MLMLLALLVQAALIASNISVARLSFLGEADIVQRPARVFERPKTAQKSFYWSRSFCPLERV